MTAPGYLHLHFLKHNLKKIRLAAHKGNTFCRIVNPLLVHASCEASQIEWCAETISFAGKALYSPGHALAFVNQLAMRKLVTIDSDEGNYGASAIVNLHRRGVGTHIRLHPPWVGSSHGDPLVSQRF